MDIVDTPSSELIQELRDRGYALSIWNYQDVLHRSKELNLACTEEEAREICTAIDNKQDCNIGITWNTIDYFLQIKK